MVRRMGWALLCLPLLMAGCTSSEDEMREAVLRADPSFADLLKRHEDVAAQVMVLEENLAERKRVLDANIRELRLAFREQQSSMQEQVEHLQSQLDPPRESIRLKLRVLDNEVRAKRAQLGSASRTTEELRRYLRQPPPGATADDIQSREHQFAEALEQMEGLKQDVSRLQHDRTVLQYELRLLNLR